MPHTVETPRALRSVHGNFGEGRIPEKDFEEILGTCVLAANASNRRSYSIVVDDPGAQKELTGCKGSLTLVLCDDDRIINVAERLGHADDVRGFPLFVAGMVDACPAAETAAVAARAMGIDSLFTNGIHRGDPERVDALLDLPKACSFPAVALVVRHDDPAERLDCMCRGRTRGSRTSWMGSARSGRTPCGVTPDPPTCSESSSARASRRERRGLRTPARGSAPPGTP